MYEIIKISDLKFSYGSVDGGIDDKIKAINGVELNVFRGQFVSILGRNGSGKSTLAKIINALLIPCEGICLINGINSRDDELRWEIRKVCGMVFQNPDNQIIGTSVEEDVAFGLENIGVPSDEIRRRINDSMRCVGIYDIRDNAPHLLSGGQKQRVAIAGILAMKPECIVLDEATAMLDPIGRREVIEVVRQLNKEFNITILHITHNMDETVLSDRIVVMDEGSVVMTGNPKEVFSQVSKLKSSGLDVPQITELVNKLIDKGFDLPRDILTVEEFMCYWKKDLGNVNKCHSEAEPKNLLCRDKILRCAQDDIGDVNKCHSEVEPKNLLSDYVVITKNLKYVYSPKTPFETEAIKGISINIKKGSFTCIIGHTGCGKSTLMQHFNGLLKPTSGEIFVNGNEISKKDLKELRKKVGLLFQYPEQQLFEETVYKDIAFGLKQSGYTKEEIDIKVKEAAFDVGLDEELLSRSIYDLSGGQKRRAAIAGVIIMEPDILVLDEPTAGLDPEGRDEILKLIKNYHIKKKNTILFVSHSMEDVARLADHIFVMNKGFLEMEGTAQEVFSNKERLEEIGLAVPQITYLMSELNKLDERLNPECFMVDDALKNILRTIKTNIV